MAEMRPCLIGQSGDLVFIGDIARHADRFDAMPQGANLIGRCIACRLLNIGNHDMAFFGRQRFADIEANAIGTAANDRNFIREIFHDCPLLQSNASPVQFHLQRPTSNL